jgi:ribosome-associated translation inhibitor RaiA
MQININTDSTIEHNVGLDEHVQTVVDAAIHRFRDHITRVEAHLSDNNSQKSADGGNRCMLEVRMNNYQPIAVSDHAATLHQAIAGAAEKLKHAIEKTLGRLADTKRRDSSKASTETKPDLNDELNSELNDELNAQRNN